MKRFGHEPRFYIACVLALLFSTPGYAATPGDRDGDYVCISYCDYDTYDGCASGAANGSHWMYDPQAGSIEGASPVASSSIALNKIIRQQIFTQAQPKAKPRKKPQPAQTETTESTAETKTDAFYQQVPGVGRLSTGAADAFYNKWEVGEVDGATIGLNPSITWGEDAELTLTAPLHLIMPDEGDNIFSCGLDGAYKRPLTGKMDECTAGVHAYGLGYFASDDTATAFGGGPFLAWNRRLNEQWLVSAGGLLEITKPDEGDTVVEIVPAVNAGYNLSENVALNGFVIYYRNLDSDVADPDYTDIGLDVLWVRGGWAFSGGFKTAVGLDNVDSTEFHLGSSWIF